MQQKSNLLKKVTPSSGTMDLSLHPPLAKKFWIRPCIIPLTTLEAMETSLKNGDFACNMIYLHTCFNLAFKNKFISLTRISAPQAHAWFKLQPSPKIGLALMPDEAQVILKWRLGLPLTPDGTPCPLYHHNMDAWGHHMLTCRSGGDVITRHNQLRDCIADFCHKACLSPQIEKGSDVWSSPVLNRGSIKQQLKLFIFMDRIFWVI